MAEPAVTVAVVSTIGAVAVAVVGGTFTYLASRGKGTETTVSETNREGTATAVPLAELLVRLYSEKEELEMLLKMCQDAHEPCSDLEEQLEACQTKLAACERRKKARS